MFKQAIAWYIVSDGASFGRTDTVDLPETLSEVPSTAPDPISAPTAMDDEDEDVPWDWLHAMGGYRAFRRLARSTD